MIQKNKNLQTVAIAGKYLAPKIKVKEIRCRRVLCQSYGGTNNMTFEDERGNDDFE